MSKLLKISQQTYNVPARYDPQCEGKDGKRQEEGEFLIKSTNTGKDIWWCSSHEKRLDGKGRVVIEKQNGKRAQHGENGEMRSQMKEGTRRAENSRWNA